MAITSQISNIAYPNIVNGGGSSGTISTTGYSYTGAGVTLNTGAGTITNGATYTYASPSTNFYSSNQKPIMTIPHGEEKMVLDKEATLEVNGTVVINGIDLDERLKTIEKVLQIPTRDVTMEHKYPKLKQLYEAYMHELEKYKTWDRVKGENE